MSGAEMAFDVSRRLPQARVALAWDGDSGIQDYSDPLSPSFPRFTPDVKAGTLLVCGCRTLELNQIIL